MRSQGLWHHLIDGTRRTYHKAHATLDAALGLDFSLITPEAYRPLGANLKASATASAFCTIYMEHVSTTPVPFCDPPSSLYRQRLV